MTLEQVIGLILALLVMGVGVVGSLLPGLPGSPVILLAAIGHRLYFGDHGPSTLVLIIIGWLMVVSMVLDHLAGALGAKKFGATWWGVAGAIVGMIVGMFFGPPGLLLGPFVGAALLELVGGRRKWKEALCAGTGAALGLILGSVGKLACCCAMIALFTFNVVLRSG